MIKILLLCLHLISCQAGCEDGAKPGPNGYQYIGSQFEYVSEVVEQKLSLDGSFDEFRFAIKFQSTTTRGSEYALTINPEYEPVIGVKDVVLLEMQLNNDRQVWLVDNGLIKNLATEHTLGVLENGNIAGFTSGPTRNFMWHYDGYCLRSEDDGKLVAFDGDDLLSTKLGKSVKLIDVSVAKINSTIDRLNIPPGQPKATRKSYIQHASIEYQVATLTKQYKPTQFDSYIYYYNERQFSKWNADDQCTTVVIFDSDLQFGLENVKIGSSVKPYPLPPKHYFRYGRDFNTSYERTAPFDEFETCYFDTYNDLEENQFQKLIPYQNGWLTPSGGVFVERQPTREYKDKFGRTMVEESFEYFIDYGYF